MLAPLATKHVHVYADTPAYDVLAANGYAAKLTRVTPDMADEVYGT
ncbi:hypothetical protein [Prevotella sp.]|nr:hypothetical protein [Prevotella sp.]